MPVSAFTGLQTSLRGLLAQQRAIDTTGHNIANASTEGFSRQEAVLSASAATALPATGGGVSATQHLGSGVDVMSYRRVRDGFLDLQYRAQNTRLGDQSAKSGALDRAQLSLAEPSDNGIANQLDKFWSAWSDFANAPEDAAARNALVEQGKSLTEASSTVDSQLKLVGSQAMDQYNALTASGGDIDSMAKELGQLNGTIKQFMQIGDAPNDLLDRRDQLLDKLSAYGQVSVTDLGTGSIRVNFGDAAVPLVDDQTVTWPQALTAPGGQLGALKNVGDTGGAIDSYRADLNQIAKTVADAVNGIHGTPPFFSYTAGSEAASLTVSATATQLKATSGTTAGANDIASQVAALKGGAGDQNYRAFVAKLGTDVREAQRQESNAQALVDSVNDRRQSTSGVALDEEMTNLIRYQRAYQASARTMSTMDEMLDTLINRTGRVGL